MIKGNWHPKGSAAQLDALLSSDDLGRYVIEFEDGTIFNGEISQLKVSERLGNVRRKIYLEDGSLFSTLNNDAVDELFQKFQKVPSFIYYLETRWTWVATALFITILVGFSFFKWGIPWTSEKIAHALPYETNRFISKGSMTFLDKILFEESNLSKVRQDEISKHFYAKLAKLSVEDESEIVYKLHFRSWEMDGNSVPNALALPSGDIIVTDKFIELTKSFDEIDSVLLHEMGHVVHRHGLEMMIEGTFVTVAVMMISGDGSGVGDMGVGLGSALVSSSYSRGHESEADLYAFKKMLQAKINPVSFSHIMNRMTAFMGKDNNLSKASSDDEFLDYFASHPSTKKRVELANKYSECFKKGLTVCE